MIVDPSGAGVGMRITFKLFATLSDYLPPGRDGNELSLEVAQNTTIDDLVARFKLPPGLVHLVLIDGVFVPPSERAGRVLHDGEVLAIWPPVAGG